MADLYDRLFPGDPEIENIAVHYFRAGLGDYAAGFTSRPELVAFWDLDVEAQADLNTLCDAIDGKTPLGKAAFLIELHDVLLIAEARAKYTTKATFAARIGL